MIDGIDISISDVEILSLAQTQWKRAEGAHKAARYVAAVTNDRLHPRTLFTWFNLHAIKKDGLTLRHPATKKQATLSTGDFTPFFTGATHLLAAVYTLGGELDKKIVHPDYPDEMLRHFGYMGALAALTQTASFLTQLAEKRAQSQSVGVSPPLSPGSIDGWEFSGQSELCALFPMEELGVAQKENGMLSPMNTLSVVIAMGPGFTDPRVGSPCRLCRMKGSCTLSCSNHRASALKKAS